MKSTLTMIVRDEARNLGPCLEGLSGLFDEMVVVDTGSTDDTKEIAAGLGARVFDFPWVDDFAAARNAALGHAQGEWIFWLDADDRVDGKARGRLAELLAKLPGENVGYLMQVDCPAADGLAGERMQHLRLFRNDPRIRWEYRIHEQIAPAVLRSGGKLRDADVDIQHVGYREPARRAPKLARNLRLLELDCAERPRDVVCAYHRARLLLKIGRADEVAKALAPADSVLARSRPPNPSLLRAVMELKARASVALGRLPQALEAARALVVKFPRDLELLFLRDEILAAMGSYEAVVRPATGATLTKDPFATVDAVVKVRSAHLRAQVHLLRGEAAEAVRLTRWIIVERVAFGPAWITLGVALLELGDRDGFEHLLADLAVQEATGVAGAVLRSSEALRAGSVETALALVEGELEKRRYDLALLRARAVALLDPRRAQDEAEVFAALARVYAIDPLCPVTRHAEHAFRNRTAAARKAEKATGLRTGTGP